MEFILSLAIKAFGLVWQSLQHSGNIGHDGQPDGLGAIGGALTIARWRIVGLVVGILWVGAIVCGYAFDLVLRIGAEYRVGVALLGLALLAIVLFGTWLWTRNRHSEGEQLRIVRG